MLPTVAIFSKYNLLSLRLAEELLLKQCLVVVMTDDTHGWAKASKALKENENFKIYEESKSIKESPDYFVFLSGFAGESKGKERSELETALAFLDKKKAKTLFIFPLDKKEIFESLLLGNETKRVYVGEIYGPKMDAVGDGVVSKTLFAALAYGKVTIPSKDADVSCLYVDDIVPEVIRYLFSYGFSGKSVSISQKTTIYRILKELQRHIPDVLFNQGTSPLNTDSNGGSLKEPRQITSDAFEKTFTWVNENKYFYKDLKGETQGPDMRQHDTKKHDDEKEKKQSEKPRKSFRNFRIKLSRKFALYTLLALAALLISPFIFLAISAAALKFSFDSFLSGNAKLGSVLVSVSDASSSVSLGVANLFVPVPILGKPYVFASDGSTLVKEASVVGRRASETLSQTKTLFADIFNDKDYDPVELSRQIAVNLELLYQDSSFLQSEIEKVSGLGQMVARLNIDLNKTRKLLLNGRAVAKGLPELLGVDKTKTYMILFQNSMELRPTGGFIGSFALATFNKGKLANVEFFDVYTADGQLKGHVEPPAPIKNYLGEANWFLRDSNWDPDFAVSSQRAEWFLDKELERSVDGVVGIDLEVPESFLRDTGPVRLADFNQDIDYKNLYEKVQYEVESKFFPGSQNKTNILTALGQAILEKFKDSGTIPFEKVGRSTYQNLESRHIQIFLHEPEVGKAISSLGWAGEVEVPQCPTQNCQGILAGLVEANVGVDKANYFIARTINFSSFVSSNGIENTMTVELKNNAPLAIGVSGRYKDYIRVVTNPGAVVKQVGIIESGGTRTVTPETQTTAGRLEIGTLVDIAPGAKKAVRFTWTVPTKLDFNANGNINYLIRKQAGVGADPISIKIAPPSGVDFLGKTSYNTNLDHDIQSNLSW